MSFHLNRLESCLTTKSAVLHERPARSAKSSRRTHRHGDTQGVSIKSCLKKHFSRISHTINTFASSITSLKSAKLPLYDRVWRSLKAVANIAGPGDADIYVGMNIKQLNSAIAKTQLLEPRTVAPRFVGELKTWQDLTADHIASIEGYAELKENKNISNVFIIDPSTGEIPLNPVTKNPEGAIYSREIASAVQRLLSSVKERLILPDNDVLPYFWSGVSVAGEELAIFLEAYPDAKALVRIEGGKKKIAGENVAAFLAEKLQGVTLESLLDKQHLLPPSAKEYALNPDVQGVWVEISKIYAGLVAGHGGEVRVFLKGGKASPSSMWSKKELPLLSGSAHVAQITTVDPLTGKQGILFERLPDLTETASTVVDQVAYAEQAVPRMLMKAGEHQRGLQGPQLQQQIARTMIELGEEAQPGQAVVLQHLRVSLALVKMLNLLVNNNLPSAAATAG